MTEDQEHTANKVQDNVQQFKEAYRILVDEVTARRKKAGLSQAEVAECLKIDRRKIISVESGEIKLGVLLRYADLLDVETKLNFKLH